MVTVCTAFARPWARTASRRDAGMHRERRQTTSQGLAKAAFPVAPGRLRAASRRLNDATASRPPTLLTRERPEAMQTITITRTGS